MLYKTAGNSPVAQCWHEQTTGCAQPTGWAECTSKGLATTSWHCATLRLSQYVNAFLHVHTAMTSNSQQRNQFSGRHTPIPAAA